MDDEVSKREEEVANSAGVLNKLVALEELVEYKIG